MTSTSTPSPTSTVDNQDDDDDGLSGAAIAGIIIGCIVGAVLILIVIIAIVVWYVDDIKCTIIIVAAIFYRMERHRTKTVNITPSLVYKNVRTSPEGTGNVYVMTEEPATQSADNDFEETSHL